ncbi:MAG: F0F1 ATP synthase subunit alpha [Oscillospiraceae bacterium]
MGNKNNVNNIRQNIDSKINDIDENNNVYEVGKVVKIQEFMIEITGLDDVAFFERINIEDKAFGYVTCIKRSSIIVAITKENKQLTVGDKATGTGEDYKFKFSTDSLGHIIDIFGNDLLSGKEFDKAKNLTVERDNTSILDRSNVQRPLLTGIAGIDLIYPIGKGQRQLIIGDKSTGKTQIALDTIVNQKDKNLISIYVAIGKTKKEVKEIYTSLSMKGAMKNTIILSATNDMKTPVLSLAPYVAVSIAQAFMQVKRDVLIVIDDLKRHADAYREISLLSGKVPGREAYPPDIFYTHSRMLEKGCQHKDGGSISILPIVETKGGDISDYISTNIISITDGQIVLSKKIFDKGQKPAIDYGLSVSRLGGAVQDKEIKHLGTKVRRELLSYLETKDIYELSNPDEMSPELRNKLKLGKQNHDRLNQYKYESLSPDDILELFKNSITEKSE